MTIRKAWLEYQKTKKLPSGFTAEEEALLTKEYEKYLAERYKWEWKDDAVMDFDTWWRTMADNAKANREGK